MGCEALFVIMTQPGLNCSKIIVVDERRVGGQRIDGFAGRDLSGALAEYAAVTTDVPELREFATRRSQAAEEELLPRIKAHRVARRNGWVAAGLVLLLAACVWAATSRQQPSLG